MFRETGFYDEGLYVSSSEDLAIERGLQNLLEKLDKGETLRQDHREFLIEQGYNPDTGDFMDDDDMSPDPLDEREEDY